MTDNKDFRARRFRVFDLRTPWFWLVAFYRRQYGEPIFTVSVFDERGTTPQWWFTRPQWEDEPDRHGVEAVSRCAGDCDEGHGPCAECAA